FLDDMALLVDLDRIDAAVIALVPVLLNCVHEGRVNLAETVLQDLAEADKDRWVDTAKNQLVDQFLQVDGARGFLTGVDPQVAVFVDGEIAFARLVDVVQLAGIGCGPPFRRFDNLNAFKALYGLFVLTSPN